MFIGLPLELLDSTSQLDFCEVVRHGVWGRGCDKAKISEEKCLLTE